MQIPEGLIKYAIQIIESGILDYETWSNKIKTRFEDSLLNFMGMRSDEIDNFIIQIWNYKIQKDDKFLTFKEYAKSKKKKPDNIARTSIDKLFQTMEEYRHGSFFLEMLKFSAHFKELAPYNAMMVRTQMPSARYVLNKKRWKEDYDRKPCRNARPLIILRKYGPIDFVFEISDTEPNQPSLFPNSEEDILKYLSNPYKTSSNVDDEVYKRLIEILSFIGIKLETFRVGAQFGAEIVKEHSEIKVRDVKTRGYYIISVNDKADKSTAFASICHELGHLLCHHLTPPTSDWWSFRQLSWEQKEFEAEIVSYIICERYGVGNKSWEYLSNVLGENGKIPDGISIDRVFKAANEIDRMLNPETKPHTCLLYYNDKNFKKRYYDKYKDEIKLDKETDNNLF